jgi:uncharacterized protein (DUF1697 family)
MSTTQTTRLIALMRGVNIGKRRVTMAAIRDGLEAAGCTDVATYLQSGNAVFSPPIVTKKRVPTNLAHWVGGVLGDIAGFDVPVVIRTADQLQTVFDNNPYGALEGTHLHVSFYADTPTPSLLDGVALGTFAPEHITLIDADMYMHLPNGMGQAKLPAEIEKANKRAKLLATTRNFNTVVELIKLAKA